MDRSNPFRSVLSLREAMDRLLEDAFIQPAAAGRQATGFPIDMVDRGDHLLVRASLAGVNPDEVQVQVQGEALTISGQVPAEEERGRWLIHEHPSGELRRVVSLPHAVEAERAEAQFLNGMLTLTLPKVQRTGPHQIKISASRNRDLDAGATRADGKQDPAEIDPTQARTGIDELPAKDLDTDDAKERPHKDAVTMESEESFPASNPPSWTPERA